MRQREKQITVLILGTIVLFSLVVRLSRLGVPFERDEGEYAYAGQLILQGVPPYQEVYNMKFPGIYGAYALFLALFGQTHHSIHFSFLLINLATIIAIYILGSKILSPKSALAAAAIFAILSMSRSVEGFQAHAEHLVIFLAVIGIYFLLKGIETWQTLSLFSAGFFLGLSMTMKQHGLAFILFALIYLSYACKVVCKYPWQRTIRYLCMFSGGIAVVIFLLLLIMFTSGVFHKFLFWTFIYGSKYVSQMTLEQGWEAFKFNFKHVFTDSALIWLMATIGFFFSFSKKTLANMRFFLITFSLCSFLAICPGFYFRPHYFVLLLPCLAILAAVLFHYIFMYGIYPKKYVNDIIAAILLIVVIVQPIYKQRDYFFRMNFLQLSRATYWLNPFHESLEIAKFIKQNTTFKDRIAILGSEPQILFYSQRRSVSPFIYMYPLMETHNYALKMQKDFIHDLESKTSKYLIYVHVPTSWLMDVNSHRLILDWVDHFMTSGRGRLVGLVELYDDHSLFFWNETIKWPASSLYWVAIFENIQPSASSH